jgi:predicted RecB family nuclease
MFPETARAINPPISTTSKDATWRLAIDVRLQANELESRLLPVERVPSEGRGRPVQFIPHHFAFVDKLTKNDKLSLAFDAFVLSKATGCEVSFGKITHGDTYVTQKVKLSTLASPVQEMIKNINTLLVKDSPPDLVLNRHCSECEFQARCRQRAAEKDELSLLSGLSEKERKRLHSRGIFTITQLSYTFRPRRRPRGSRDKMEKFHYSLRALAIRENKIHAVDLASPKVAGTPVYLDVEGLPDDNSYYLIGLRVRIADRAVQYSFWADDEDGEQRIWDEFLNVLSAIPDPHLVHYGSYETIFLKRMRARYGTPLEGSAAAIAVDQAANLLSFVFARIYFPTFSNRLKDIASYLGFRWSGPPGSGLEAIVWRHRWKISGDPREKQALLDYNRHDCEALELLANTLAEFHLRTPADDRLPKYPLMLTSDMKQESPYPRRFGTNTFALSELEAINSAAYWHYQRDRVYVKSQKKVIRDRDRNSTRRNLYKPDTTIECARASKCPNCKSTLLYRHGRRSKTLVDLRFMRHGIKRWITRFLIHRYRCRSCQSTFYPRNRLWPNGRYGPNLVAYTVYQTIDLRLPQSRVALSVDDLFGVHISRNAVNRFKATAARDYGGTYDDLLTRLCNGRLLHVDETNAGITGSGCYVWVLTSMEEVAYIQTPTREGDVIQNMLKKFSGVLVSDFYAAYDAINCPQQKCLVHLIRDLNEQLLKNPYDDGMKRLAAEFTIITKAMVETVDRWGLKKHFLRKHRISVDRFYRRLESGFGTSEAVTKFVDRLQKNRDKLFAFLQFDGVPWNNNNAEHAIKAYASLRRVFEGKSTERGLTDFLILLSICETCKYKEVNFLDFLRPVQGTSMISRIADAGDATGRAFKSGSTTPGSTHRGR